MTRVLYWADLHVGHDLVAGIRGFETAAEHDEALAEAWIKAVTKRDSVWLLGDLAASSPGPALELLSRLPGTKHAILGNHDPAHPMHSGFHRQQRKYFDVFASVQIAGQRTIGGRPVLLSHFPYEGDGTGKPDRCSQWRLRDEGKWLVHGHVHEAWRVRGRQINVGVDHWDAPVQEDELAELIDGQEKLSA